MKMTAKHFFYETLKLISLATIVLLFASMTTGGKQDTEARPVYVDLQEDQGNFSGTIQDDLSSIQATEIAFSGSTNLGGILKENDSSINNTIELAEIKELEIINPNFKSARYCDRDVMLVKTMTNAGKSVDDLLVPRNVILCAKEKEVNMKKVWYLRDVKKITIEKRLENAPRALAQSEEEKIESPSFFGKIINSVRTLAQKLDPTK